MEDGMFAEVDAEVDAAERVRELEDDNWSAREPLPPLLLPHTSSLSLPNNKVFTLGLTSRGV